MTATDELRKLLDERGVEHEDDEDVTRFFGPDGFEVVMQEDIDDKLDCLTPIYLTPAQAIEATLGRGECHEVIVDEYLNWRGCGNCGYVWEYMYGIGKCTRPNFCPRCGAKVVGA